MAAAEPWPPSKATSIRQAITAGAPSSGCSTSNTARPATTYWPKARVSAISTWAESGRHKPAGAGRGLPSNRLANTRVSRIRGSWSQREITAGGIRGRAPLGASSSPREPASSASGIPQRCIPSSLPSKLPTASRANSSPRARPKSGSAAVIVVIILGVHPAGSCVSLTRQGLIGRRASR